jgi:hypothetical protein
MTKVRDIIKRDIGVKVEGVVKVFDRASLATEIREYVVTDKIEEELKRIFDTFTYVSATLRRGGPVRDVMGIWISGFFGSGKSHFAKVLGHVLQNTPLDATGADRCIDVFARHLSETPRGQDIRLRLGESKRGTETRVIAFEIKSRQSLSNPNSVGEILLSEFYRSIGLAENFVVARIERRLQRRDLLERLEAEYSAAFGVPWRGDDGRDDLMTVRRRLAVVLPKLEPSEYPDERAAKQALDDMFRHERITAEGIADELSAWVDAQKTTGGKSAHLVFVIDEMGTFIGDSNERITELNSLAEMIGNKGKGKVWLIVTSQQDLERVVDRTNFQPALIGRLNARFELKPHLISDEINKVVSERILKKHPSEEDTLRELYRRHEGHIAQLADLRASRHLDAVTERSFIDAYPLLPHQIRLAQDIFEALSGFRISGGVRSMISVVMETLQDVADEDVGVLVSFDQIFDAVENDLLSQEYLGASGVRAIYESDERMPDLPIEPARVLKVLWLLEDAKWVPRVPETMAKLLVRDLVTDIPSVRGKVERTLLGLQEAGYVARDEATGEWKFLNERERTIEQAIQEMIRPGGSRSISLAAVRRISQQMCKEDLVTRKRLGNFAITHGVAKVPFSFGVSLDGETIEAGADMEVRVLSPLAPGRSEEIEEIRRHNQAIGTRGRVIWWVADASGKIDARLRRYEALVKVTSDKRFIEDASADTQTALSEKRKERDELRQALVRDHEKAFLDGTMFYGGQEVELNGVSDFKEPVTEALTSLIPNIYPLFTIADRTFDFAKQLRALLNPSTAVLHSVAPELELFDTQGSLQRESALVAKVLEVINDLEDEGIVPLGADLLDARDRRGFKGFSRPPFGWPDELLRLVLAACFRAGAIFLERQSGTGAVSIYDYKASDEYFSKITSFKKVTFRIAETSLSVEQIKQASRVLIAMGVTGVPESGNAIASAIRELGASLRGPLDEAELRQQQGLPIADSVLGASKALDSPTSAKDPTVVVTSFLAAQDAWVSLHSGLKALRQFLDADRHHEFEASQRLNEIAEAHPIGGSDPRAAQFIQVRKDMAAIAAARQVIERWPDYRDAFESAFRIYRDAYLDAYVKVRAEVERTIAAIKDGAAYREAPPDRRDAIVASVFGEGRVCHYPPITPSSIHSLLEAAGRRSLTSLAQALVALPGYRSRVQAELEELTRPLDEKIYQWGPARLLGKRFRTEKEVDETLSALGEELKKPIRDGYTVVVK